MCCPGARTPRNNFKMRWAKRRPTGTAVEMGMPSDAGLDTREPMFYATPQPPLPVKDYQSGADPLIYTQPSPTADATR